MVVRAGRDPTDLARESEPSAQAIRNWVVAAGRQNGRDITRAADNSGLMSVEKEELLRLTGLLVPDELGRENDSVALSAVDDEAAHHLLALPPE
jgi:hypothetical protein